MNRRDCKEGVRDVFLYMLPVYLAFYQALLVAGTGRAIVFVLLTFLLMFLVANRGDIGGVLTVYLKAPPSSWIAPAPTVRFRELAFVSLSIPIAPSLSPLFQRPPPIFS